MIPFIQIRKLTANNQHTEAIRRGLDYIKFNQEDCREYWKSELGKIENEHSRAGNLTSKLKQRRDGIYGLMMDMAREQFNEKEFKEFHGSF